MDRLRNDAEKFPLVHSLIIALVFVAIVCAPLGLVTDLIFEEKKVSFWVSEIFLRLIVGILGVILLKKYSLKGFSAFSLKSCAIVLGIALIVCINNFPIIASIKKEMVFYEKTIYILLYVIYCFSIAFAEEIIFRAIIAQITQLGFLTSRHKHLISAVICSGIFALVHLVNLANGTPFLTVLLQVGYAFLIGAMLYICFIKTNNVLTCVFLHFIYDLGGLLTDKNGGIATGEQWNLPTIIITVTIGLLATVFFTIRLLNADKN